MASKGVNKVIIVGNLGQDPEVRYTQAGKAVASLSIATSDSWKDQSGQTQEKTEWHKISMFGKLAEIAGEYLRKGSQVYIEGKLQTRKWQDKEGKDRYSTEVIVDGFDGKMQMLGGGSKQEGRQHQSQNIVNKAANMQNMKPQQVKQQEPDFDFDDDIPF